MNAGCARPSRPLGGALLAASLLLGCTSSEAPPTGGGAGATGAGGAGVTGGSGGGSTASAGESGSGGTIGPAGAAGTGIITGVAGSGGTAGAAGAAGSSATAGASGAGQGGGNAGRGAAGQGGAAGAAGRGVGGGGAARAGTGGGTAGRGGAGGQAGTAGTGVAGTGGSGGALPSVTVWIAGDSTVANGSAPCPIGWGADFQALLTSRATVMNSAIAGRSVRTWLYSVQSVMDATGECVLDLNPDGTPVLEPAWQAMLNGTNGMKAGDTLIIQFGINDSDSTCPRHVGTTAFEASYGMMAQAAVDRGAQPVFVTPPSSISCSGTKAVATRGAYVPATKDAGSKDGVPVIDLNAATVALYNAMSFCPIPGGGDVTASTTGPVGDFFCDDHTHFSASGAPQIAALIAEGVRSLGLPLAAYLK